MHCLACDVRTHVVVDAAPREDHVRVVADQLRLVRQIIGIDTDAVAADQAGAEGLKIPLGSGCVQDFHGVETELVENDCKRR